MPPVAQTPGVVPQAHPHPPMDNTQPAHHDSTPAHANGGGGDGRDNSGGSGGSVAPAANGHASQSAQNQQQQQQKDRQPNPATTKKTPAQKDDKSSASSLKDREERLRQLRDRQQMEKQQKLEELKEHAAAAQRFREQQENERRRRMEEMRMRDADRRLQVEERKKIIQQAEQDRREAVIRKNVEREQRLESKRRNERSNIVFAFGSSTPRMLDPKDNSNSSYWTTRRATSTTNVHMVDGSLARRASECGETDLSRKRATSAHGLDRKPEGEDLMTRSMTAAIPTTAARRRTDLMPAMPSLRDNTANRSSPRHRSPGRALSLGRLDELARPRHRNPPLAPLHESSPSCDRMTSPTRTMSKSMSHLGPRPPRPPGPEAATNALDRGVSRSSVSLAQPRLTRAEMLRQKKLRGAAEEAKSLNGKSSQRAQGMRSGTVTPNSPSRPTSALSQGSTNSSQVSYRPRTSPRKPRPLSIAGSSLSSADKPRDAATEPREGRTLERKLSVGSASSITKPTRAKSAGSERSTPSTPSRTPVKTATPKKTPAQVKAESAAKKAVEKSKSTPKAKVTPKTTPLQSPSVESKPMVIAKPKKSSSPREGSTVENKEETPQPVVEADNLEEKPSSEAQKTEEEIIKPEDDKPSIEESSTQDQVEVAPPTAEVEVSPPTTDPAPQSIQKEEIKEVISESKNATSATQDTKVEEKTIIQETTEVKTDEGDKTTAQKASEKPVTGYATEEEYKAALAEKRRQAREAKERELELERQRQLEEEERERREEEEYLRLMEEQRKAEEERLQKAIEEAERNRIEEAKRKEEEEKQREEAERIEQQKREEAEVRLKKEEEERQARKSRVAAIMARTRGKGGSNTPTKNESKTPSEEGKNFGDGLMSTSMTESMTSSMIAEIQAESAAAADATITTTTTTTSSSDQEQDNSECSKPSSLESSQAQSSTTSHTVTTTTDTSTKCQEVNLVEVTQSNVVEDIVSGVSSVKLEEPHVNGDSPIPMETTPTHTVDLLGTLSDVNSVNLNGVDNNTPPQTSQGRTDNLLESLDPLSSSLSTSSTTSTSTTTTTTTISAASNFEQIIDLSQTKLNNEDAVNSNPPSPFIAFEQNLNKKPNQENTSTVPDLLL